MADYEDQTSSEYKDMNLETPAADQNPHSAGNVPQNPNPAQPDQQNPPQNDGQIPPQNPRQDPYWQNQQYNGQVPPQNGQPPYWQDQPQRPRREKNSFAAMSLISGIFALLTLCCFAFPVAIICGVGAICFAIISKRGRAFRGTAIAGIILGVIAILLGIGEFFYALTITNLMKDPANAAAFNQFFEQFQQQFGIN